MAGQTYQVNYIIDVNATNAQSAINSFKQAVSSLNKATKPITDLQRQVRSLMETMSVLGNKTFTVKVDTKPATQKIGKLIRALQMARNEVQQLNAMGIHLNTTCGKANQSIKSPSIVSSSSVTSRAAAMSSTASRTSVSNSSKLKNTPISRTGPNNLSYKLFGHTQLPNNGGIAVDMLKGMGIAYGIAGMGTLVSDVVNQAAEYDNIMKTVENILQSHDSRTDFQNRYNAMSSTIRDVGMKTKYKVTEVADAAKFLAMAGLDVDAISQAIRPIADIALVGDTELGETADLVTNIMTAYNIAPSQMRRAADIMTNTFTMSNTTLTEIAESYKYAASLLSAGGVSFGESTAAIGVLGDAGIKGSQAGTTLRTIMANIVNPTKKQNEAWSEIGVSRYNKDGSKKSLLEIFRELNKANLDVSVFYRLFNKTAASGATALATHVDKWEDVYLENYLSNGLTAQLAEKKKNTIQGLWAQLFSVFTDNGVSAFSGVQGLIKSLMSQAINWLKTDEAKNAFQNLSKTLMEFVNTIITASKWFAKFINFIAPLFKLWVKFQLMIWPVVKAVTAFKAVFYGLIGLRKIGLVILNLGNAFKFLGKSAQFAGVAVNSSVASGSGVVQGTRLISPAPGVIQHVGPLGSTFALSNTEMRWAQRGLEMKYWKGKNWKIWSPIDITEPRYDRGSYDIVQRHQKNRELLLQHRKNVKAFNRRLGILQGINMAGSLAGSVGVGIGVSKMMEDDNTGWGTAAGGLYAAAGVAAMLGPWGIAIGGILGVLGGLCSYLDSKAKSTRALDEITSKMTEHKMINGAITNSENDTMQYLEMQYLKYNDINSAIEKRIELTSKLLGLTSQDSPLDDSTGTFSDLMKKGEDLTPNHKIAAIHEIYDKLGVPIMGVDPRNAGTDKSAKGYISAAATAEVFAPGGFYENLTLQAFRNVGKLAMSGAPYSDVESYLSGILNKYNPANIEGLVPVTQIDPDNPYKTIAEMLKDEQTAIILFNKLSDTLNPIKEASKQFYSELASGQLTLPTLLNFTEKAMPSQGGATLMGFDPNNVLQWFSGYHFQDGKFVGFTKDNNYYTPQDAAALAASDMQSLIKLLDLLGVSDTAAGQTILGPAKQLLSFAQAYTNSSQELIDVNKNQELIINGQLTKWDELSQTYRAIGDDGQFLYISSSISSLGQSIGTLGKELNLDWSGLSNDFSDTMNGTYNYLLWLGRLKFGNVPFTTIGNTDFSQPDLTPFGNVPFSITNTAQSQVSPFSYSVPINKFTMPISKPGFGFNNSFLNTKLGNAFAKPRYALGWTLQEASNIAAAGGASPKGWNTKTNYNTGIDSNDGTGTGTGTHTSDYRSHQKERAIPKQINISIQNLMNVDSIDMTNPNNAAVVNNLKREIAYALYEAAADGTMMLNNLTN